MRQLKHREINTLPVLRAGSCEPELKLSILAP